MEIIETKEKKPVFIATPCFAALVSDLLRGGARGGNSIRSLVAGHISRRTLTRV